MTPMAERFEMRVEDSMLKRVDEWRAHQDDYPSRAEAMRRLAEKGMDLLSKDQVQISDGEKLIVIMLCDIYKALKIKDGEINPGFVSSAIFGGHLWALRWELSGLFHGHTDDPRVLNEVVDILDMWSFIEEAFEKLSKKDRDFVKKEDARFSHGQFPGFDGNNESTHRSIALFMTGEMNRFSRFKGRELNSHFPVLDTYRSMYEIFEPIRKTLTGGHSMNAKQLVEVLKAAE